MHRLGLLEGAQEFERREGPGLEAVRRVFGVTPSCYGQPGNSWAPQANIALRKLGVPVYMDDGDQVGFNNQPFWYGGMLYAFNMQGSTMRADLNDEAKLAPAKQAFDKAVAAAKARGGGVLQSYYHPTEWAATEFWDAVNFKGGANPPRAEWKRPNLRTPESAEKAYRLFFDFVKHAKATPGVRIVTARELPRLMENPVQPTSKQQALAWLRESIDSHEGRSAADLLLAGLGVSPRYVDGPERPGRTTYAAPTIPRWAFDKAKSDAADYIIKLKRLPNHVWIGTETLSLAGFTATFAADSGSGDVAVRKGELAFERHIAKDAAKSYNWVIHAKGFAPEELLELARLQAWTLKAAVLRK